MLPDTYTTYHFSPVAREPAWLMAIKSLETQALAAVWGYEDQLPECCRHPH
jgi:hypothetical protein